MRGLATLRESNLIAKPKAACTKCGMIGVDAQPDWAERPVPERLTGAQWMQIVATMAAIDIVAAVVSRHRRQIAHAAMIWYGSGRRKSFHGLD
jgi:hypothetical protein